MKVQTDSYSKPPPEYNHDQDVCQESRSVMTFLINLGVTETLCSFRLVLKGKKGNEIPALTRFEVRNKISANNFSLSDLKDNTSETRHSWQGILDKNSWIDIVKNTISNSPKFGKTMSLGSDWFFCFISTSKFKNPFVTNTSLPNFVLEA